MSKSAINRCIKKAGKALAGADRDAVLAAYDDAVARGVENPAEAAVNEVIADLQFEREMMLEQVRVQGGSVQPRLSFAKSPFRSIAEEISSVALLDGDETLDIPDAKRTKDGKIKATAKQLAIALVKRTVSKNRGRKLDSQTERTKEIVAEAIAIETEAAIKRTGHAGNWYSSVLQNAVNVVSLIHKELATDHNARNVFLAGLAIASNGNDVDTNSVVAEEIYAYFKKHGRFPERDVSNQGGKKHFQTANLMLEKWGLDGFVAFLNTEFTVGELTDLGFSVSGENANFVTHGSAVFGPKVGAGFFQNLMGNFDPITMDRWFMRTWGRLTGTLMPDLVKNPPTAQMDRLVDAIRANPKEVQALGWTVTQALANPELFAAAVHKSYAKSANRFWVKVKGDKDRTWFGSKEKRDALFAKQQAAGKTVTKGQNTYANKTELNKAGKTLDMAINAPIIAPISAQQRIWIREVTQLALEKLNERGVPANSASMQALIWYPEKELYLKYGVGNAKSAPTDYEQEFVKLALQRGIPQSRIDAVRAGDTAKRGAGAARRRDAGADQAGQRGGTPPTLGTKGKRRLRKLEVLGNLRQQLPRAFRGVVPKGREKLLDGAPVVQILKPVIKALNALRKLGLATPTFVELGGVEGARVFHAAIAAVKKAHPKGAAVNLYSEEEYADMRLFLTRDKRLGFALTGDGDIVSVFKDFEATDLPDASQAVLMAAVSEGGKRLDAFDTELPFLYSTQGFRVVSRVAWDDNEKPPGWKYKDFKDFKNGRPDVVFMVFDRTHRFGYTGANEGQLVAKWGEASDIQLQAVDDLDQRNNSVPGILLRISDEDSQNINQDPTSPFSWFSKLKMTVEQQGNLPPANPRRNIMEQVSAAVRKGTLANIPRRYFLDYLPKARAAALRKYLRLANRLDGRRNQLQTEYEATARRFAQFVNKAKETGALLSELMHVATLAGIDPSKKYAPLKNPKNMTLKDKEIDVLRRDNYRRLKDVWDGLPAEAQAIFEEVRESYKKMNKRTFKALQTRIMESEASGKAKKALLDELRQKFEAGRVRGVYFPLMRYGDWIAWATEDTVDAQGTVTETVVSFSRFENKADRKEWADEMANAGFKVHMRKRGEMDNAGILGEIDPGFVARVGEMAREAGNTEFIDEIWQMYLQRLPDMSMRKQFIHRKGRLGYAGDALRAYSTIAFRSANQQAKLEMGWRMTDAIKELEEEVAGIENDPTQEHNHGWATTILDEVKRRHERQMNPQASSLAIRATGFGFLFYLGFTPAAAIVNFSQTPLVALPVLGARFGNVDAAAELGKAAKQWAGARGPIENRLRGEEYRAVVKARRSGLIDKTQAHDLASTTEYGMEGKYNSAEGRFMDAASWAFHKAEVMNREVTFLAAYRLARKNDIPHADAILVAENLTWDSHFDYNNANRPPIMQSDLGRVVLLFKQYSLNMTYRMMRDFRNAIASNKNISSAERKQAKKRFAGMMTMAFILGGYMGLPTFLTLPIELVAEALFDDEDDPFEFEDAMYSYISELFNAEVAEWFMRGAVDGGTGATLSSRVSLGQLWFRDLPDAGTGEEVMQNVIKEALGPLIGTFFDAGVQAYDLMQGDLGPADQAIERVMPKVFRDLMRSFRYATEGALSKHTPQSTILAPPGQLLGQDPQQFDALDIFWTAVGFTPTRLTEAYEQRGAFMTKTTKLSDRRADLMKKMADAADLAHFNSDMGEMDRISEMIARFNEKNPLLKIERADLAQSFRRRLMRDEKSIYGQEIDPKFYELMLQTMPRIADKKEEEE